METTCNECGQEHVSPVHVGRQFYQNNIDWSEKYGLTMDEAVGAANQQEERQAVLDTVISFDFDDDESLEKAIRLAYKLKGIDIKDARFEGGIVVVPLLDIHGWGHPTSQPLLVNESGDVKDPDCSTYDVPSWRTGSFRLATKTECIDYAEARKKAGYEITELIKLGDYC